MKQRLKFKCCNAKCGRIYSLFLEFTPEQVFTVRCPYCNSEGKVDLRRDRTEAPFRKIGDATPAASYDYQFPDVIPTEPL